MPGFDHDDLPSNAWVFVDINPEPSSPLICPALPLLGQLQPKPHLNTCATLTATTLNLLDLSRLLYHLSGVLELSRHNCDNKSGEKELQEGRAAHHSEGKELREGRGTHRAFLQSTELSAGLVATISTAGSLSKLRCRLWGSAQQPYKPQEKVCFKLSNSVCTRTVKFPLQQHPIHVQIGLIDFI